HPSRVRGLKCKTRSKNTRLIIVAPLAGAWIEIIEDLQKKELPKVAPLAGAWIEICDCLNLDKFLISRTPRGCVD
ncbi:hypothetical protein HMPREF1864_01702, partial [Peptoniphilus sp. DNF00840]